LLHRFGAFRVRRRQGWLHRGGLICHRLSRRTRGEVHRVLRGPVRAPAPSSEETRAFRWADSAYFWSSFVGIPLSLAWPCHGYRPPSIRIRPLIAAVGVLLSVLYGSLYPFSGCPCTRFPGSAGTLTGCPCAA